MPIKIGQVVPDRGIVRLQLARLFPLLLGTGFVVDIVQETAESDPPWHMLGMQENKVLVSFADRFEALQDARAQRGVTDPAAGRPELLFGPNPLVNFLLRRVIRLEHLAQLRIQRVFVRVGIGAVRVLGCGRPRFGGDGGRRGGGGQSAEDQVEQPIHGDTLTERCRQATAH